MENIINWSILEVLLGDLRTNFYTPYSTSRNEAKVIAEKCLEAIKKNKKIKNKNNYSTSDKTIIRFTRGCKEKPQDPSEYNFLIGKESSLNTFAVSLGYENIFDFCQKNKRRRVTTEELFDPSTIHPAKLKKDDIITIGWKSIGFYVDAKYLGRNHFEIIATAGTERTIGEKINAKEFSIQNIIYLNEDSSIGYKSHPTILFMDSRKKWHDLATKNIDTSTK